MFVDPAQQPFDFGIPGVPPLLTADVRAVLEQRPDTRNQWTWNTRFIQYFTDWDAALHLDYRLFHNDWGINAHTFEAAWGQPVGGSWTITPRVRYYSQDQADFYRPFFLFKQAVPRTPARPPDFSSHIDYSKIPITDYSSDHRLSGYGALSGGLTVSKQFAKGVELEASFEYYTHQGDLKLGGRGEGDFADFDNFLVNAGLRVDLSAPFLTAGGGHTGHADDGHTGHSGGHAPAGVMFDHMLPKAGDFMVGYRYMYSRQDGDTTVSWVFTQHPGATVGYKIEIAGRSVAYVPDNEFLKGYVGPPHRLSRDNELVALYEPIIEFLTDVQLLLHEAQYTNEEYSRKIGWGHSALSNACILVKLAKVRRWVVTHHDPMYSDDFLQHKLNLTRQLLYDLDHPIEVSHAYDGLTGYVV